LKVAASPQFTMGRCGDRCRRSSGRPRQPAQRIRPALGNKAWEYLAHLRSKQGVVLTVFRLVDVARPAECRGGEAVLETTAARLKYKPQRLVTDGLRSCGVAYREVLPDVRHRTSRSLNAGRVCFALEGPAITLRGNRQKEKDESRPGPDRLPARERRGNGHRAAGAPGA
jgi:hypothetical protein